MSRTPTPLAPHEVQLSTAQDLIRQECDAIKELLLEKNKNYGNSVLDPVMIASKASSSERILTRIDDKLSRLGRGDEAGEDAWLDLMGYIVLLRVARRMEAAKDRWRTYSPEL